MKNGETLLLYHQHCTVRSCRYAVLWAGLDNALSSSKEVSGTAGTFWPSATADCRHRSNLHPARAVKAVMSALVFYVVMGLLAFAASSYSDLYIWAVIQSDFWCRLFHFDEENKIKKFPQRMFPPGGAGQDIPLLLHYLNFLPSALFGGEGRRVRRLMVDAGWR